MKAMIRLLVMLAIAAGPIAAQTLDLKSYRIVDLTHAFNAKTLYWPTSTSKFALDRLAYGPAAGGYFYSANSLSTPEHGGTHLDAPLHFAEKGRGADAIPLEQLIAPAVVIDVTAQAAASRDYRLTREDVLAFEKKHGQIGAGTVVLGTHRLEPVLARGEGVSGRRHAGRCLEIEFPELRRRSCATAGRGASGRRPRHRHGVDRLWKVD